MASEFAVIILFSLETKAPNVETIIDRFKQLSTDTLFVHARQALDASPQREKGVIHAEITARGADQMGIIETITLALFHNKQYQYGSQCKMVGTAPA